MSPDPKTSGNDPSPIVTQDESIETTPTTSPSPILQPALTSLPPPTKRFWFPHLHTPFPNHSTLIDIHRQHLTFQARWTILSTHNSSLRNAGYPSLPENIWITDSFCDDASALIFEWEEFQARVQRALRFKRDLTWDTWETDVKRDGWQFGMQTYIAELHLGVARELDTLRQELSVRLVLSEEDEQRMRRCFLLRGLLEKEFAGNVEFPLISCGEVNVAPVAKTQKPAREAQLLFGYLEAREKSRSYVAPRGTSLLNDEVWLSNARVMREIQTEFKTDYLMPLQLRLNGNLPEKPANAFDTLLLEDDVGFLNSLMAKGRSIVKNKLAKDILSTPVDVHALGAALEKLREDRTQDEVEI